MARNRVMDCLSACYLTVNSLSFLGLLWFIQGNIIKQKLINLNRESELESTPL